MELIVSLGILEVIEFVEVFVPLFTPTFPKEEEEEEEEEEFVVDNDDDVEGIDVVVVVVVEDACLIYFGLVIRTFEAVGGEAVILTAGILLLNEPTNCILGDGV